MAEQVCGAASPFLSLHDHFSLASCSRGGHVAALAAIQSFPVVISVIMPIYNAHGVGLSVALRDVLRQARCPAFEVVACDDGSTDGGRAYLAELCRCLGPRGRLELERSVVWEPALLNSVCGEAEAAAANGDDEHSLGGRAAATHAPYASRRGDATAFTLNGLNGWGSHSVGAVHSAAGGDRGDGTDRGIASVTSTTSTACFASVAEPVVPVLPAVAVARAAGPGCWRLRVISTAAGRRGQGAAMDAALAVSSGPLVALMESDDTRPPHALAVLAAHLAAGNGSGFPPSPPPTPSPPGLTEVGATVAVSTTAVAAAGVSAVRSGGESSGRLDLVCSEVELVRCPARGESSADASTNDAAAAESSRKSDSSGGSSGGADAEWAGMARYVGWQNGVRSGAEMAAARFVEIPALHQSSLYRRDLVARLGGYNANPAWPVDSDFWLRFFAAGCAAAKVSAAARLPESTDGAPTAAASTAAASTAASSAATVAAAGLRRVGPLYGWRMHVGQGTRNSGRCSAENLRRCKAHYLAAPSDGQRPPGNTEQRLLRA